MISAGFSYRTRLALLALLLSLLWFGGAFRFLDGEGERLWKRVRSGQRALWADQLARGIRLSRADDKLETGFIGVEWSPLTTTLGDIAAKRTSCNPLWSVRCLEWFDRLGLVPGDRVVIYSSSSFPGLLFSVLAAAEERELDILLSVSLGASTWGANRTEYPWPLMRETLAEGGFIATKTSFYTPGGAGERGAEFSDATMTLLSELSAREGAPLIVAKNLEEAIAYKMRRLEEFEPRLVINIGGSNANLGDSERVLDAPNGLLLPESAASMDMGDGVIGNALRKGTPVLHLLNMRKLAGEAGIPWDPGAWSALRFRLHPVAALAGLLAFIAVLLAHKRWKWQDE